MPDTELTLAMADLNREMREFVRFHTSGEHNQREAYRQAYGNNKSDAVLDAAATRLLSNVKIKRAIAAIEAPKDVEAMDRRQRIIKDTDSQVKVGIAAGKDVAALLTLSSRQEGMLSDKVIHEDAKTEEIKEAERKELEALAQQRVIQFTEEA